MKKKIEKMLFVLQIMASDFVALYCLYQGRIVAIGTQCFRKQFLDFAYH